MYALNMNVETGNATMLWPRLFAHVATPLSCSEEVWHMQLESFIWSRCATWRRIRGLNKEGYAYFYLIRNHDLLSRAWSLRAA